MKKATINKITNAFAIALFLFGLAASWFDKMDDIMLLPIVAFCVAAVAFKNESLKKLLFAILKIKQDA